MPKATILITGLAIKDPNSTDLSMKFINDGDPKHPHKLEMCVTENEMCVRRNIRPGSEITVIPHDNAEPIKNDIKIKELEERLINLDNLHGQGNELEYYPPDHIPFGLSSLNISRAIPFSAELTNDKYELIRKDAGEDVYSITPKEYTYKIGAEFQLDAGETIRIKIVKSGVEVYNEEYPKEGQDVKINFDNHCVGCDEAAYNDFHLYYQVLNGKKTRIYFEKFRRPGDSDIISCNPVRGGGG